MDIDIFVGGTGRLALIAGMFEALRKNLPGYFTLPEAKDFDAIDKALRAVKAGRIPEYSEETFTFMMKPDVNFRFVNAVSKSTRVFIATEESPELQDIFVRALETSKKETLFLIADPEAKFSELVELSRTKYRGHSAVAKLPVNDDQPMRFIINFMLNQGVLDSETAKKVSEGTKLHDEKISVMCGHELLEPVKRIEPAKKGSGWKFAAIIAIVIAIAAGGSFLVYRRAHQTVVIYEQTAVESQTKAEEEISEAKSAQIRAIRERNIAVNERDAAIMELETLRKIADRLQKENDALRAELKNLRENMPKKDGVLSGPLKKVGL